MRISSVPMQGDTHRVSPWGARFTRLSECFAILQPSTVTFMLWEPSHKLHLGLPVHLVWWLQTRRLYPCPHWIHELENDSALVCWHVERTQVDVYTVHYKWPERFRLGKVQLQ